jgi:RsiW-degrading membrane proteinase PrsW (M82 family)
MPLIPILVALLPVLAFLGALVYLDSYRLVKPRSVLVALGAGMAAAGLSLLVNMTLSGALDLDLRVFTRYLAPVVEETLKSLYILWLLRKRRIGFMVDAAILGFAIGTGFALVENVLYVQDIASDNMLLWVVRGFGTAIMHGGTTGILAVVAREVMDRKDVHVVISGAGGMLIAILIHSAYNHFFFSPALSALFTLIGVPAAMVLVYTRSEKKTQEWLGVGFDTDQSLWEMLTSGELADNRVGTYLHSLQEVFGGPVLADLLCYLRIHCELSIRAKGVLMMREAGLEVPPDPAAAPLLQELQYLEKSIGTTGLLALKPFLNTRGREQWQAELLKAG